MVVITKNSDAVYTAKRFIVWRDACICQKCGKNLGPNERGVNIDHIIPRSILAISKMWNLELLCKTCNFIKGSEIYPDHIERCKDAYQRTYNKKLEPNNFLKRTIYTRLKSDIKLYEFSLINHYNDSQININNWCSPMSSAVNELENEINGLNQLIKDVNESTDKINKLLDQMRK